jgi:hypothetical protein
MQQKLFNVLVVLVGLMAIVCQATTTESSNDATVKSCYVCNEANDKRCAEPYSKPAEHLQKCAVGQNYCRKAIQKIADVETVVRQCATEKFKGGIEGCYKTAGKATQHVCTCNAREDEGCNHGTTLTSTSALLLLASTAILKFLF